jgi:hypothetical protein
MDSFRWQRSTMIAVVALGVTLGACSDDKKKPTDPEPGPEVPTETETFRGTIPQSGHDCNNFSMANAGDVGMEVVDFEPLSSITMGLTIGQPDPGASRGCASFATDDSVRIFQTFVSSGLLPGTYCVCLFDVGNIFPGETITYEMEVTHPE